MNTYLFETPRLRVRPFIAADVSALYQHHLEPAVKRWIPNESYADLAETQDAIAFYADCVRTGRLPYVLAVEEKVTGELVGDTGVNEVEGCPGEVEIGDSICAGAAGKGLATELVSAMTSFVDETFAPRVLYGRVLHGNAASVRVMEKCGYVFLREEVGAADDPYGKGMLVYRRAL